mmetsp:Transcript_16084/g.23672  ORF Transcript_16084/g.23672 Transcript_16084/m.23672 type:complete len:87 (-) Transcript_16084:656-916(-)
MMQLPLNRAANNMAFLVAGWSYILAAVAEEEEGGDTWTKESRVMVAASFRNNFDYHNTDIANVQANCSHHDFVRRQYVWSLRQSVC